MAARPPAFPGQMPSSFDGQTDERSLHKVVRKIKEEPLIPLGVGLTVFAFVNAWRATRRGDSKQANKMFRARVGAQGFTVLAMVAGSMYYSGDRAKSKELRKLNEQRDAEEKRQAWIRELEARDEEDKALAARMQQRRREIAGAKAAEEETKGEQVKKDGGTGGVLSKMGLWSSGEQKAEKDAAAKVAPEVPSEKQAKKENPNSSLGVIGEIVSAQGGASKGEPRR